MISRATGLLLLANWFMGPPFQSLIWRLAGSVIQCHSLEDGYFQSGYTSIGAMASVGVKAFVHYDVTIGDGAILDADSFVMKGEEIFPNGHWRGNPASDWTVISEAR